MRHLALLCLAALGVTDSALAVGSAADVEVIDSATGHVLPIYRHAGHYYVAGEPGHEYGVRVCNREAARILAVASVDGVNVVSGETASPGQTGYILDAYEHYDILGWRKSLDRVASFYFTSLPDSYAARTGRAHDVGVIGVAVFNEKVPPPMSLNTFDDRLEPAPAPPATAAAQPSNAPLAAEASGSAARASDSVAQKAESRLGTGHGRSVDSNVAEGEFERASTMPADVVAIYYDSRQNLIAHGIIPRPSNRYDYQPNPFPNSFVPDP
jgi:hypothetical protein